MIQVASVGAMTSSEPHNRSVPAAAKRGGRFLSDYDDDTLMLRAQEGDKESYEVLVGRHMEVVIAVSTRFLADPDAGRDVAQDVFLELWTSRHKYAPAGKFKGYLTTLVLNRCRDATRRRGSEQRRRNGLAAEGLQPAKDPSDRAVEKQSSQHLHLALGQIDPADREVLVMRYGLDMAYDEIAEETGRPAGTLRSRVFHSLRKLRTLLEGES